MPSPDAPVLILDDNPGDRGLLRRALLPAAPRRPLAEVGDVDAARTWLASLPSTAKRPLLLLDWSLGRVDGAEALAVLRADPALAPGRVVVLTGGELTAADQARAFALGVEQIRRKPLDLDGWTLLASQILVRSVSGPDAARALAPSDVWVASGKQPSNPMSNAALALPSNAAELESVFAAFPNLGQFVQGLLSALVPATSTPPQMPGMLEDLHSARERKVLASCRRCGIRLYVAGDLSEDDQATVAKRHAVVVELLGEGWSFREVQEFIPFCDRTLRRIAAVMNKKAVRAVSAGGR